MGLSETDCRVRTLQNSSKEILPSCIVLCVSPKIILWSHNFGFLTFFVKRMYMLVLTLSHTVVLILWLAFTHLLIQKEMCALSVLSLALVHVACVVAAPPYPCANFRACVQMASF